MTAFSPSTGRIFTNSRFSGTTLKMEAAWRGSAFWSPAGKTRVRNGMRFSQANLVAYAIELSFEELMK